ncbi:hypothetical protein KCU96_g12, partial [Aureobasidium melanogenum]
MLEKVSNSVYQYFNAAFKSAKVVEATNTTHSSRVECSSEPEAVTAASEDSSSRVSRPRLNIILLHRNSVSKVSKRNITAGDMKGTHMLSNILACQVLSVHRVLRQKYPHHSPVHRCLHYPPSPVLEIGSASHRFSGRLQSDMIMADQFDIRRIEGRQQTWCQGLCCGSAQGQIDGASDGRRIVVVGLVLDVLAISRLGFFIVRVGQSLAFRGLGSRNLVVVWHDSQRSKYGYTEISHERDIQVTGSMNSTGELSLSLDAKNL